MHVFVDFNPKHIMFVIVNGFIYNFLQLCKSHKQQLFNERDSGNPIKVLYKISLNSIEQYVINFEQEYFLENRNDINGIK